MGYSVQVPHSVFRPRHAASVSLTGKAGGVVVYCAVMFQAEVLNSSVAHIHTKWPPTQNW